jgi:hypothetical protein
VIDSRSSGRAGAAPGAGTVALPLPTEGVHVRRVSIAGPAALVLLVAACGGDATVSQDTLEQEVRTSLTQEVGQEPAEVDCPDDLDAEVGATTRCTITADDGTRIGSTVRVTEIEGDTARFHIQVDDAAERR